MLETSRVPVALFVSVLLFIATSACSSDPEPDVSQDSSASDVADMDRSSDDVADLAPDRDSADEEVVDAEDAASDARQEVEVDVGPVFEPEVHSLLSPRESVLPSDVDSCPTIAAERCSEDTRQVCRVFDPAAGEFPEEPPELVERVFYYDRYMDLYQRTENSGLTYYTTEYIAPGTPEGEWADPELFQEYKDHGDGAFYMGNFLFSAAHRYAVTGTEADYERMVQLLERQLNNWRVTGVPGYMIRSTFAMLDEGVSIPPGFPQYNLHEHKERSNHVIYTLAEERRDLVPAYYYEGVDIDDDRAIDLATTPTMEGSPSLDAYSGALLGFQAVFGLLREDDSALRDEVTEGATCFLRRLRKIRIRNLSGSVFGQAAVDVLTSGSAFHPDDDDIDLSEIDTLTGFMLEAIPPGNPGNFEFDCPEALPTEVDPDWDLDAADPDFAITLLDLASRMSGEGDYPIDFVYFVSHRGGDVAYLLDYAIFAYHATGEHAYLDWIQSELIEGVPGLEVLNTLGSFFLPPPWIGGDLIHPVLYALLGQLDDDLVAPQVRRAQLEELKSKLFENDNNAYFGMTYAASVNESFDSDIGTYAAWAAEELAGYAINPEFPLDPKRNYNTDYIENPVDGYDATPPTEEEVTICETGIFVGGSELVPGPGVDSDFELISRVPLPVGMRVPHDMIWHFSPFNLKRDHGSREGRAQMMFIDLTLPFWIGRYHGLIESGEGMALAWEDTEEACD